MARKKAEGHSSKRMQAVPDRDTVLAYLKDHPHAASRREIARHFGIKGAERAALRDLLQDMADDGLLEAEGRKMRVPGQLPPVTPIVIMSRDADGGLMARPRNWDQDADGFPPAIAVKLRKDERRPPGIGDEALAKIFPAKGDDDGVSYTARIIKVFDKAEGRVLGVVRQLKDGSFRLEPVERRQDEIVLPEGGLAGAKPGDLVEVSPNRGNRRGLASGSVEEVIGQLGTERAVSAIAIHAHGIPHIFPDAVIAEARNARPISSEGREDWREVPLVTIDPADAKDHDDAVFAKPDLDEKNPGGQVVTVAIADVAAYVRSGSAMDREALKRGNSVYFPDRVVPMLPERISNDLCSLREGEDRPALAVRMVFDSGGRKVRHSFHRVLMRSPAKLAYEEAQTAIDGAPTQKTEPLLKTVLEPLWAAYRVLSQGRKSRGPLELDLPERKIRLKEDGTIDRIEIPPRLDAHRLIEEFMIQANVCAAETLERKKHPLIYRVHDEPSLAKQEVLREFLKSIGQSLQRGPALNSSAFNGILERTRGGPYEAMASEIVLRTQSQAVYSPYNLGHFGLSLTRYAHFTSPIRRYADLIVHRALISALNLGDDGLSNEKEERLDDIAALISGTERRAMIAERETVDRLTAGFLAERIGEPFDGRITGVTKSGLFIQLDQFGADGFVPISSLGDEYYHFDEAAFALSGDSTGLGWRIGDAVEVKLLEVQPLAGSILLEMQSEPHKLSGIARSRDKARAGQRRARSAKAKGRSGEKKIRKGRSGGRRR
ncbi:ribonuclease R [Notoacmeibacter sp. MSK16QG-6]|uniref:ribonuclease R n=1 Tax=Notoacmeibacter sp. MSK16QG-6 TaxID=2957982 RepID=UPI00209D0C23|nr:ribonuclease R [Notoacmeibacter sp. MSK16QG-6]MCP1197890.1 ribonuclease R [Notoacmeibacter sp. MSK16QG-6]